MTVIGVKHIPDYDFPSLDLGFEASYVEDTRLKSGV